MLRRGKCAPHSLFAAAKRERAAPGPREKTLSSKLFPCSAWEKFGDADLARYRSGKLTGFRVGRGHGAVVVDSFPPRELGAAKSNQTCKGLRIRPAAAAWALNVRSNSALNAGASRRFRKPVGRPEIPPIGENLAVKRGRAKQDGTDLRGLIRLRWTLALIPRLCRICGVGADLRVLIERACAPAPLTLRGL